MKTKSETQAKTPTAPKIPELQRKVTEMKESLAAAKKRLAGAKENHKRAKKAFKLAKRDAKSVRKKLKSVKQALDEATVAAIAPQMNSAKKRLRVAEKAPARTKPKAAARPSRPIAKPQPSPDPAHVAEDLRESATSASPDLETSNPAF